MLDISRLKVTARSRHRFQSGVSMSEWQSIRVRNYQGYARPFYGVPRRLLLIRGPSLMSLHVILYADFSLRRKSARDRIAD